MRKKILEKRLAKLRNKIADLKARALKSEDINEVRSINDKIDEIKEQIDDIQEELDALKDDEGSDDSNSSEGDGEAQRQNIPNGAEMRGGNPLATYGQNQVPMQNVREKPYSSMEYRQAFMEYVQKGTPISKDILTRAGGDTGTTLVDELGAIVPVTIMDEFIKEVSKVYGQVYAKVRKTNIKGGVKFPISDLKAEFRWISETTVSPNQKAGDIKEYIEFSANVGEIRVAVSLLAEVLTLDIFDGEVARIMTEAYIKEMDNCILAGTGVGQPLGITVDPRVTNEVTFTTAEISDWKQWRKKLFAQIPLSKRGKGEFLFTSATLESCLLTMCDANNRPLFKEAPPEIAFGESGIAGRFYGRDTTLVEPDVIKDFDTAASGDVIGIYWVPNDYAINTNMVFGIKRYFDDDTNKWINKGLTIVDGKILDTSGCYIIKKA